MDFATAEERFYALMGRLAAGVIGQEEFQARLEELIVYDDQGGTWMIGAQSGKWYRYDGKRWVQDTPLATTVAGSAVTTSPVVGAGVSGGAGPTGGAISVPPPPPVVEADIHPLSEQRCPRCDHTLIAGATFCDRCGLKLPGDTAMYSTEDLASVETELCPRCSRPLPLAAPFCAACGYRRPKASPPPPPVTGEPFPVPPAPPPLPAFSQPVTGRPWLNMVVIVLLGVLVLCCLATAALAMFWPGSPVSLMNLLGGPAVAPTSEPTQTPTFVTPTLTPGLASTVVPSPVQTPAGTATLPPPTRARPTATATAFPTPPPLPTATRVSTAPPASPTSVGLRFRVKEIRLIEEKVGLGYIWALVLDQNGQGMAGIRIRIDGGDPASWQLVETTDSQGQTKFNALSPNIYNLVLLDYGVIAPNIDRRGKNWEVIFEAY